jgi:hypothetical protein
MKRAYSVVKSKKDTDGLTTNLDTSLKELQSEVKSLFGVLDKSSDRIRKLESCLCEFKAHFPFRYYISKSSIYSKLIEGKQKRFVEKICLSWEQAEDSKGFRLFLLSEEVGVYISDEGEDYDECGPVKVISKKPLIETDLATRLLYVDSLNPFVCQFKAYLSKCRTLIESNNREELSP